MNRCPRFAPISLASPNGPGAGAFSHRDPFLALHEVLLRPLPKLHAKRIRSPSSSFEVEWSETVANDLTKSSQSLPVIGGLTGVAAIVTSDPTEVAQLAEAAFSILADTSLEAQEALENEGRARAGETTAS